MSNRSLIVMTLAVLVAMAMLLFLNVAHRFTGTSKKEVSYIVITEVKAVDLEGNGQVYSLNYGQLSRLIRYLNTAVAVDKKDYPKVSADLRLNKIIIHRFTGENVTITPITFREGNMVFSAPDWDSNAYLMELSGGELRTLILNVLDSQS